MLRESSEIPTHIWTNLGCGALDTSWSWFELQWPSTYVRGWVVLSITLKELLPIVIASAIWGDKWKGSSMAVYCGVVTVANSGYSRGPQIMHLLRCLFFIRAYFGGSSCPRGGKQPCRCHLPESTGINCPFFFHRSQRHSPARCQFHKHSSRTSGATSRLDIADMDVTVQEQFPADITPSTQKTYQVGTQRYTKELAFINHSRS